jgi:2-dehydropantoate 2-reductase
MELLGLSTSPIKILSLGAGAVGSYIGGSLALAGHQVVFAEQEKMAGLLRERGLRLDLSADKRRKAKNAFLLDPTSFVVASSLEEALRFGPFDVAIFALKSFDTADALNEIKPFANKFPPVLCMSNGVDNEPALVKVLGEEKVIFGTLTSAIGRRGPGDILLEKLRGVGIAAGHPFSEQMVAICNVAYLNAQEYTHAASMKWSKMLTNLLANPLSAILDMTPAEIFADAKLFKLEVAVLRECMAVMKARDYEITDLPKTPVKALAFAAGLPAWLSRPLLARAVGSGRGRKMPSFHIDLHSGRGKSEVNYLHGAVVRAGNEAGVATPVNKALTEMLLSLTNGETPLDMFSHKPALLLEKVYP